VQLDSYRGTGVVVAVELVNRTAIRSARAGSSDLSVQLLAEVLATDPPSVRALRSRQLPGFARLTEELHEIFALLVAGDADAAAGRLNEILRRHPAYPHLAKEDGRWRLHHHPSDAELVPMWSSICAEALARLLSDGQAARIGACEDPRCARIFLDTTRSGTRRYCSTTCQNRVKTAALRSRRNRPESRV
jgi:predicted RNA-binding Zn ribbon-like protein